MKSESDHSTNNKVKSLCDNIVVIEEEWFADINLTDGAIFTPALIKREKSRLNPKIYFPFNTKWCIRYIAINNGCNKKVVKILCEESGGDFTFRINMPSRLPKPIELSHKWVLKSLKYQEPLF